MAPAKPNFGNLQFALYISDKFDEDLENSLISYFRPPIGTLEQLITKVCYNLTQYCEGHDKEAERNKKDQVRLGLLIGRLWV